MPSTVVISALMPSVFEIVDYDGATVSLSQDRWNRHILEGHANISGCLEGIKQTLKSPDNVWEHDGHLLYLRLGACANHPDLYLKVVLRDTSTINPKSRIVVTAYLEKVVPVKGTLKWMQLRN